MPTRHLLSGLAANLSLLGACALPPAASSLTQTPVIVFVHGNGDSASIWQTTLWRFESNGWPKERLYAIDLPYPVARDDDSRPQAGRSSSADYMAFLASEVEKALSNTGASKVVLFGNSRGGNAIRNYIFNGGGDSKVSHAILSGTPIHGVWAIKGYREGNEAAGTGPFLTALNAPRNANGDEVSGPVKWMTIRSDGNDKYAQADGLWIGLKGTATNITAAGPELKGATNVVLARVDHRETAFSPAAFEAAHQFITGKAPASTSISKEDRPVLNGKITGLGVRPDDPASGDFPNNLPLVGENLTIYATDAEPVAGQVKQCTKRQWGKMACGGRLLRAQGFRTNLSSPHRAMPPPTSIALHFRVPVTLFTCELNGWPMQTRMPRQLSP